jgi:hypothetical protein
MTRCRCGNILDADDGRTYTYVPPSCECEVRGRGTPKRIQPRHLSARQRHEREAAGLPVMTDTERGCMARPRWQ